MSSAIQVVEIDEEAPEVLAKAIIDIQASAKKLLNGPLKLDTIVLLIKQSCPATNRPNRVTIENVLYAIEHLGDKWVKDE